MHQPTEDNRLILAMEFVEVKAALLLLCFPLLYLVPVVSHLLFGNVVFTGIGFFVWHKFVVRRIADGKKLNCVADLRGKLAIVTGSNTGIGREASLELARMGCDVIISCRDVKKGEEAIKYIRQQLLQSSKTYEKPTLECLPLDLQDYDSIQSFVKQFEAKKRKVNILLNNAGCIMLRYAESKHGIESTIATNHVGHFLLTNLLLPHIADGSRIVNVSSAAHAFVSNGIEVDDILYPGPTKFQSFKVYAASKLANIWFTNHLQKKLQSTKTIVCSVHPGAVSTEFNRNQTAIARLGLVAFSLVMKSSQQGAVPLVHCCVSSDILGAGYYVDRAISPTIKIAQDEKRASDLWEKTSKLLGPPYF